MNLFDTNFQIGNMSISFLGLMIIFVVFILIIFFIIYLLFKFINKSNAKPYFSIKLISVRVPKYEDVNFTNPDHKQETIQKTQEQIAIAENLYSILGGIKAQKGLKAMLQRRDDHFSLEMVLKSGLINFYVGVPENNINFFEERIHAIYPHAEIELIDDYNIFTPSGVTLGESLRFKESFIFPLKTYKKLEMDPLDSILNSMSKISSEDSVVIQIIARSANKGWHKISRKFTKSISKGKNLKEAKISSGLESSWNTFFYYIGQFFDSFKNKEEKQTEQHQPLSQMETEMIKTIEEKNSKAGLDVNIRIVVNSQNEIIAKTYLDNIRNSFSQYNLYQYGNQLERARQNKDDLISDFIYRRFNESYKMILNTEELASIYHMPLTTTETPNVAWLESKRSGAPSNIPLDGLTLGKNVYRDKETIIKIKQKDRLRHTYIIGKSGTGKSYLQVNMVIQDIQNGEGVCVIDPHGDLIEDILKYIPKERAEDVILFDPSDIERPIAVNMLEFETPDQKTFVINEMIKIFDKLYDLKATGGPIFEQYMRNTMLLAMEDVESGSTLLEIPRILADEDFRKYKLSKCKDYLVSDFWQKQAEKAGGEAALANMVPYITSKLTPFISNDTIRPIISQQKSSFNFRTVMDEKKILLINLAKGKIGELNSNLIGMVFVGKLLMAALSRADIEDNKRHDFYLYIDEFQNFITDSIAVILSEARKYGLGLIIAHQYITQLVSKGDESIKDAVFGNAGTFITFRIGTKDAETMVKQFAPVFNEFDLVNIPAYNAYVRLLVDNYNPPAFSMKVTSREEPKQNYTKEIKELSRLKYGKDRELVESEIRERMKLI